MSPKRFHPKGLSILYEDYDIIVVDKASGLLTIATDRVKEKTAYFLLTDYVRKGNYKSRKRVFIVHRLDKDTSGLIVFAKNENAKRFLQDEWHNFEKRYYAIVHGHLSKKEDVITSYLTENSVHRVYSVTDSEKGRLSKTHFKVIEELAKYSFLEITLLTGRKNQIRAHLSEINHPVIGDKIYGRNNKGIKRLALHSAFLSIVHPYTKKPITFESKVPAYFNKFK
ncbi:MAG: RluA family pseudouridine synthase [Verrucomicrobiota bacterium]|nr:RluA family pseudouridine synthase [Verrucomicrobiota bacterium]